MDDVFVASTVEGRVTAEEDVEDNAATPQIAHVVVAFLKHFGGYVVWRPVLLIHFLAAFVHSRRAKVNDGDSWILAILIEEQILRLQVSVHDVAAVTVVDCGQDLLDYVCRILLAKVLLRSDPLKELSSIAKSDDTRKHEVSKQSAAAWQTVLLRLPTPEVRRDSEKKKGEAVGRLTL